jgi:hypothetical protein
MLATHTNIRGECLVAVGNAVLDGNPVLQHALTAAIAGRNAGAAHQHATHAPANYPVFFSGAGGSGDVVLATGDGVHCVASDYTDAAGKIHWGVIGTMTLAARARQVGGSLLYWTDNFLGYTLTGTDTSGTGTVTPLTAPIGKRDMDKYIILWSNAGGGSQYRVADFATLTYRVAGNNEINAIKAEDAAGRLSVYPVAEADWNKDYAAWKLVTAPVVTGSSSSTNLQPVLDQLAAIGKLEAADQTALITAINNLPAAVRTKIIAP